MIQSTYLSHRGIKKTGKIIAFLWLNIYYLFSQSTYFCIWKWGHISFFRSKRFLLWGVDLLFIFGKMNDIELTICTLKEVVYSKDL